MSTLNNFTNAAPITTPSQAAPTTAAKAAGWFNLLRLKARHAILIGCLGIFITSAIFLYAGYYAVTELTSETPEPAAIQYNRYQAGQERDICQTGAPRGFRIVTGLDDQVHPTYRTCK